MKSSAAASKKELPHGVVYCEDTAVERMVQTYSQYQQQARSGIFGDS
jgi:hypothetical protein